MPESLYHIFREEMKSKIVTSHYPQANIKKLLYNIFHELT